LLPRFAMFSWSAFIDSLFSVPSAAVACCWSTFSAMAVRCGEDDSALCAVR